MSVVHDRRFAYRQGTGEPGSSPNSAAASEAAPVDGHRRRNCGNFPGNGSYPISKRVFDLLVGLPLAFVAVPVIAVLAAGLACSLRCWPFFVQTRIGKGGRPFRMIKLRTLPPSTQRHLLKHDLSAVAAPRFARAVRNRHLDELPQLFLVVVGKLSLVGPRPKMLDAFEPVEANYGAARVVVGQGCTGLWQIGRHADSLPRDAPEYDLFYLRHRSCRLDVWILCRTTRILLGFGGRVGLNEVPRWLLQPDVRATLRRAGR